MVAFSNPNAFDSNLFSKKMIKKHKRRKFWEGLADV